MSTKCTLRHGDGFHLYYDVAEAIHSHAPARIYLELDRAAFECSVADDGSSMVTVAISPGIATALGLPSIG